MGRGKRELERVGRVPHVLREAEVFPDHRENGDRKRWSLPDGLGLADEGSVLRECPRLEHRGLAGDDCEVGPEEERPAGLGLTPGTVADDIVGFLPLLRQAFEDRVWGLVANDLHMRRGLSDPLRGRVLGVAVGEDDAVAELVEPSGETSGEGRLPYSAL